jgi:uncharacterized protein YbbC (DUF1343 family)
MKKNLLLITAFFLIQIVSGQNRSIQVGAEQTEAYFSILKNKRLALVVNQTSTIGTTHLIDSLVSAGFQIKKILAPEHGFRGTADAGAHIQSNVDLKTQIPIISLYGKNKKPSAEQLKDIDLVIFDIQDVGVRFYTYISTMHYVMEACAENDVMLLILDRPNPHGAEIDGPVLDLKYQSFVGMHPIPVLHGLTVGELALMINGEKWLSNGIQCQLQIISCKEWAHAAEWKPSVAPSPNLPNYQAIMLYPSLCFFEATEISIGRGTDFPFQVAGYPNKKFGGFSFIPKSATGATNPLHLGKECFGIDLRNTDNHAFTLKYLIYFCKQFDLPEQCITNMRFFNLLAGNNVLAQQIIQQTPEETIRLSWQSDLNKYKQLRKKYLLYQDFE